MCRFQVVDLPVARILLSRVAVGPTIRRGQRFVLVSYCTTVVVCIPRLLAVVVSLKKSAAPPPPPVLYMSDKINTAVMAYDKFKGIVRT